MRNQLIFTSLFFSIIVSQPEPNVPKTMSFQGFLTDSEGVSYADGEYNLIFRIIFSNQLGADINVWEETQSIYVENGLFSTILGSMTELPPAIPSNAELEIQVGNSVLSPRTPFTSVPFSMRSGSAVISNRAIVADTALTALSTPMAGNAVHATYADTSVFAGIAGQTMHAIYADTSVFAGIAGQTVHAAYADTASIVDLTNYEGNISVQGELAASSFVGDGSGLTGISVQIPNQIITKSYEVQFVEGNNVIDLDALTGLTDAEYIVSFMKIYPEQSHISGEHHHSEGDVDLHAYENGVVYANNHSGAPTFNFYDAFEFEASYLNGQIGTMKLWVTADFSQN